MDMSADKPLSPLDYIKQTNKRFALIYRDALQNPGKSYDAEYRSIVTLCEEAVSIYPDRADLQNSLGWWMNELGDPAGGLQHLAKAVALAPDDAHMRGNLAHVLNRIGRHEEALGHLQKSFEIETDSVGHAGVYGYILIMAGKLDEAAAVFSRAVAFEPDNLVHLANLAYATGQACGHQPQDPYNAFYMTKYATRRKEEPSPGHWQSVLPFVEKELAKNPDNYDLKTNLGFVFNKLGRFEESVSILQEVRKIWLPGVHPSVHTQLAVALNGLGKNTEAISIVEEGLMVHPDDTGMKDQAEIARKAIAASPSAASSAQKNSPKN